MSRKVRIALAGVGLVVIVALAWFMLISPLRSDIATTDQAIDAQQVRLAAAQAKLAQAETTRAEGQKNQARLIELAKMMPESSQIPSLLLQIQDLADQAGIKFLSITPGTPTESDGYQTIPLQLEFTGTYFDMSDFAYRAEQLVAAPGRLLTVKSVQYQLDSSSEASGEGASASPVLNVSMTLYAFSMSQQPTLAATPAGDQSAAAGQSGTTTTTAK
jgi:type IV pilus assembly protein PilO